MCKQAFQEGASMHHLHKLNLDNIKMYIDVKIEEFSQLDILAQNCVNSCEALVCSRWIKVGVTMYLQSTIMNLTL